MKTKPVTKAIGLRRLLKLAKHLRSGKLEHKKFYFGSWNADRSLIPLAKNGCGFAGCAIGECPKTFPSSWRWRGGLPILRGRKRLPCPSASGTAFFRLSADDFDALFLPHHQSRYPQVLPPLNWKATRRQVAANIEAFVKLKTNQPKPLNYE